MDANILKGTRHTKDTTYNFISFDKSITVDLADTSIDTTEPVVVAVDDPRLIVNKVAPVMVEILSVTANFMGNHKSQNFEYGKLFGGSSGGISFKYQSYGVDTLESAALRTLFRFNYVFDEVNRSADDNSLGGVGLIRGRTVYQSLYGTTPKLLARYDDKITIDADSVTFGSVNSDDTRFSSITFSFEIRAHYNKNKIGVK